MAVLFCYRQSNQTISKFGRYLRENLESLSKAEFIPIKEELKHTRDYAEIEMVRFENIRVEYDIDDAAFSLPALTIQPIVENAIRHGVRIREEGIARVSTRLNDGWHEVVISDNGICFDVSKADDGNAHSADGYDAQSSTDARYESMPALGHTFDSGTEVTLEDGQTAMQFECNRCHELFTIINSIDEE